MLQYSVQYLIIKYQVAIHYKYCQNITPISLACFAPTYTDETFEPALPCVTSGWGSTDPEGTQYGPELKWDYMYLWSYEQCTSPQVSPDYLL